MVTIEPIKNQYLTALKERQQIIDKLNEIISGLNALNFDDLTTIQAELVAIRESLQTQNTAITEINNSIGQIETELTSFDNRLITLNTNIENTKSDLTSFENDTALNLQSKVNKNGDTMTGNLGIPTTTTGTRDSFAVNGERLQNDLDNYAQMVRQSGNIEIYNNKNFSALSTSIKGGIVNITENNNYVKLFSIPIQGITETKITIGGGYTSPCEIIELFINLFNTDSHYFTARIKKYNTGFNYIIYTAYNTDTPIIDVWVKMENIGETWVFIEPHLTRYGGRDENTKLTAYDLVPTSNPSSNYTNFSEVA